MSSDAAKRAAKAMYDKGLIDNGPSPDLIEEIIDQAADEKYRPLVEAVEACFAWSDGDEGYEYAIKYYGLLRQALNQAKLCVSNVDKPDLGR